MVKDLRKQQKRFHIENQLQLIDPLSLEKDPKNDDDHHASASINADMKITIIEENFASEKRSCCFWNIFRRNDSSKQVSNKDDTQKGKQSKSKSKKTVKVTYKVSPKGESSIYNDVFMIIIFYIFYRIGSYT